MSADQTAFDAHANSIGASPASAPSKTTKPTPGSISNAGHTRDETPPPTARKSRSILQAETSVAPTGSPIRKSRRRRDYANQGNRAADDPAIDPVETTHAEPGQNSGGQVSSEAHRTPAAERAKDRTKSNEPAPAQPLSNGHGTSDTHELSAVAGDDQISGVNHSAVVIPTIIELWKRRQSWHRAEKSLTLQASAICRRYVGGDKEAAGKLLKAIEAGSFDDVEAAAVSCFPLLTARQVLADQRKLVEKQLVKLTQDLPIRAWTKTISGCGDLSLVALIGECGDIGSYKSVSALWKRMGLAVIGDGRQRRVTGTEALEHGYSPARRSVAWNIGVSLMRSQKADDCYRAFYDSEKERQLARELTKGHAHNRACRHMTKLFLKDLYVEWRRSTALPA